MEETVEVGGGEVELVTCVVPLFDDLGGFEGTCVLADDRTETKQTQRLLELRSREVAELSRRLISAAEEEKSRISRELHDGINQDVASLAVELGMLAADERADAREIRSQLRKLSASAMDIAEQVRELSHQLHPAMLETLGLSDALRSFVMSVDKRPGVHLNSQICDVPKTLTILEATCIFRIAQEAVHNALKHANPQEVRLTLSATDEQLVLEVADDGAGFDLKQPRDGLGVVGMRERARIAGGELEIRSAPGKGTAIVANIPLSEK